VHGGDTDLCDTSLLQAYRWQSSQLGKFTKENAVKGEFSYCRGTYQPLLSDSPFHSGSVRTILSINFFHSIPSEMTLCHSLHTSSAAQSDLASR